MTNNAAPAHTPEDPFDKLDPKDGFHVIYLETHGSVSLHVHAYAGGELYNITDDIDPANASLELVSLPDTDENCGQLKRLHDVADAVARYFTLGGSWRELDMTLKKMEKVLVGGIVFPGYHFTVSNYFGDEGWQHIFTKDCGLNPDGTHPAVVWEQPTQNEAGGLVGGWINHSTLENITKQQEEDGWGETEAEEEAEEADEAVPRQLQHRPNNGTQGQPVQDPES